MAISLRIVFALSLWVSTGICYHYRNPCAESDTQKHIGDIAVKLGSREGGGDDGGHGEAEEDESEGKRAATAYRSWLWPDCIVYYRIELNDFTEYQVQVIRSGIEHWEENTCISFLPRTDQRDFINIFSGSYGCCASYVGRTGGEQGVSLNTAWCVTLPIVIHEIGHAIGFWHEQSRPDRDDYVDVLYENILDSAGYNFQKQQVNAIDSLGVPYDYRSIMHYSSDAWSWNGEDTIVTDPGSDFRGLIGDATELSGLDIAQANLLCGCDIDECKLRIDECGPHFTCQDLRGSYFGSYRCDCEEGYTLSSDRKHCEQNFCDINNGGCSDICDPVQEHCSCHLGFSLANDKKKCIDVNECKSAATHTCTPAQVCVNTPGSYYCVCRVGYVLDSNGVSCIDVDECRANSGGCEQNCVNIPGSFLCTCNPGYVPDSDGKSCNDEDECSGTSHSCSALEDCVNTLGSYECHCKTGYQLSGNGDSCIDVDECQANSGGCEQNCVNIPGSFLCTCNPGYVPDSDGKSCNDEDECSGTSHSCSALEDCVNTLGSYECHCKTGYQLSGDEDSCIDVDECQTNSGGCEENCVNIPGSFLCTCNPGYVPDSDGKSCNDEDECSGSTHSCSALEDCVNTVGSYECHCKIGYQLSVNGESCIDIDECQTDNGGCEQTCSNSLGTYECDCNPGYSLDTNGESCNDDNECSVANGGCAQLCSNKLGSFECSCNEGFTLDADSLGCTDVDECASTGAPVCSHVCENTAGGYECSCNGPGYMLVDGKTCLDINECEGDVGCSHFCINTEGSYTCGCHPGYNLTSDGHTCYIPRQNGCGGLYHACNGSISSPNWPTGVYDPNSDCEWTIALESKNMYLELSFDPYYHIQGTYGSVCTTDSLQMFQSNGTDEWMMMGKYCGRFPPAPMEVSSPFKICFFSNQAHNKKGFGMKYTCKEENDECKVDNGGCNQICVNTPGSYTCKCEVGYEIKEDGKTCADIDECGGAVCNHTCHNTEGSFVCSCHDGYKLEEDGTSCVDIDECTVSNGGCAHSCQNHVLVGFQPECSCYSEYQLQEDGKSCVAVDGCGGYFTTSSGTLTSPNYPNKHPNSADCWWKIVIPETDKAMRLVFSNSFYLKSRNKGKCRYDYVEVFNGNSSSSVSMGKFCGREPPAPLFTSTNEAVILFHSNHQRNAMGFELSFEAVDSPTGTFECGGSVSSGEVFGTPGFPSYQLNTNTSAPYKCTWYHHSQASSASVEFKIIFFDLGDCPSNVMRIYDGETIQAPQLTSLCGPLQDSDLVTSTHGSALTLEVVLVTAGRFLGVFLDV